MSSLSLSLLHPICRSNPNFAGVQTPPIQSKRFPLRRLSASARPRFHSLRFSTGGRQMLGKKRGLGVICSATPLAPRNLYWISTVSSAVLMLSKGTAVQKSFLVPLFALQAPSIVVSWIKGEYGLWTAFLALLVRLFFFIPGELELPFAAFLLVIVAPYQTLSLRGTQGGHILALVIAGYLAYQHFYGIGDLRKAFVSGSVVATLAIICITAAAFLLQI